MKNAKVYIVAPNRFRFMRYCEENKLGPGKDAWLLNRPRDLFGVRGRVEFAPGYDRVPEYHQLADGIRRKAAFGDVVVPDWWLGQSRGGE